jgi:membrane protease YdiL (CAAX protease family)
MSAAIRKTFFILTAIMLVEAFPFVMALISSPPGVAGRLYGFDPAIWPAWLAAAAIVAAYVAYAVRALPLIGARFFEVHWLKLVTIPFAIVTGSFEELFFRKGLMDWAMQDGAGATVQIAASAILFGLAHGIWGLFGRQWRVALGAGLATGTLGGLLAIVYLLGGRQIAPCIWAHMLINLAIEPWLILAAVSARESGWARARAASG